MHTPAEKGACHGTPQPLERGTADPRPKGGPFGALPRAIQLPVRSWSKASGPAASPSIPPRWMSVGRFETPGPGALSDPGFAMGMKPSHADTASPPRGALVLHKTPIISWSAPLAQRVRVWYEKRRVERVDHQPVNGRLGWCERGARPPTVREAVFLCRDWGSAVAVDPGPGCGVPLRLRGRLPP